MDSDGSKFVALIVVAAVEALLVSLFTYDNLINHKRPFEEYQQQFSIAEQKCDDGVKNFNINQTYECEDGTEIDLSGVKADTEADDE